MKRWMKYIKPYRKSFILGPLGMIIEVIGEMFMPLILGMIINEGYEGTLTVGKSIGYAAILVVIVLFMMTGGVAGAYLLPEERRKTLFKKKQPYVIPSDMIDEEDAEDYIKYNKR